MGTLKPRRSEENTQAMAWDNKELHRKFEPLLGCLEEGSSVALLTMRGSCCPVTRAHCDMFQRARSVLLGQSLLCPPGTPPFSECLGLLALNPDRSIKRKFERRSEAETPIRWLDRAHLIRLATAEVPWLVLNNREAEEAVQELKEDTRWQHLKFVHFHLNGADDVARWEKWKYASATQRYITIGRPEWTEKVLEGAREWGVLDTPHFHVAADLPDISATAVRAALRRQDRDALDRMLHPSVAEWCLRKHIYSSPPQPEKRRFSATVSIGCDQASEKMMSPEGASSSNQEIPGPQQAEVVGQPATLVKVSVPTGAVPGQQINFTMPNGQRVSTSVQEQVQPGATLTVSVPSPAPAPVAVPAAMGVAAPSGPAMLQPGLAQARETLLPQPVVNASQVDRQNAQMGWVAFALSFLACCFCGLPIALCIWSVVAMSYFCKPREERDRRPRSYAPACASAVTAGILCCCTLLAGLGALFARGPSNFLPTVIKD
eukprot:s5468_g1.t1